MSSLATANWTDLSRGAKNDVIVTDIKRNGEMRTWIVHIEDKRDVRTGNR